MNAITNLKSVKLFSNYIDRVNNINKIENRLTKTLLKIGALAFSIIVLVASITIFITNDVPVAIKNYYNSLRKKNPFILQLTQPFILIGTFCALLQKYQNLMENIQKFKKASLYTIAVIGVCAALYSIKLLNQ